jgi:hypothetical protein
MKLKSLNSVCRFLFCCVLASLFTVSAQAQDDLDKLITEYKDDGTKLVEGYIDPFMKSLSLGLNQGWYNTAKPHKVAGLDLTITANAMYIPTSDKVYNVSNLNKIELAPGQSDFPNGNVPTIFGVEKSPVYQPKGSIDSSEQFDGPSGIDIKKNIGINALPVPMVQLGFGLPKGIDLKLRFFPKSKLGDDGTIQLYGIGVMHDVKQYIPGIKLLPFDLSVFAGYTHLGLNYNMSGSVAGENQKAIYEVNSTTIQGIISKKVSVLTVYGSLGYNIAKSNLAIKGTYDTNDDGDTTDSTDQKDPLDSKFAASGMRVTGGLRLKLWVFTLHGDYTLQKYSCLSVGFGINIR